MTIKPIRNDDDLAQAFIALERVFLADYGTPQADERDVLLALIECYENQHYPISHATPLAAIEFAMEQFNLSRKDMEQYLGVPSKVSEILSNKRPLSLGMIKRLHKGLNIPYESLMPV
ncbi:MAG: helix-turn-helix domain-containing protein [Moraxella sp.]|nr:helix-turn-helix domain-containing protein [Moraxella sp.]